MQPNHRPPPSPVFTNHLTFTNPGPIRRPKVRAGLAPTAGAVDAPLRSPPHANSPNQPWGKRFWLFPRPHTQALQFAHQKPRLVFGATMAFVSPLKSSGRIVVSWPVHCFYFTNPNHKPHRRTFSKEQDVLFIEWAVRRASFYSPNGWKSTRNRREAGSRRTPRACPYPAPVLGKLTHRRKSHRRHPPCFNRFVPGLPSSQFASPCCFECRQCFVPITWWARGFTATAGVGPPRWPSSTRPRSPHNAPSPNLTCDLFRPYAKGAFSGAERRSAPGFSEPSGLRAPCSRRSPPIDAQCPARNCFALSEGKVFSPVGAKH